VQGEAVGPAKSSLHHVLSALSPLSKRVVSVLLVKIARFPPAAVGGLDPLSRVDCGLVERGNLMEDPIVMRPNVGRVPLLADVQFG
jgi:hypothetical protein